MERISGETMVLLADLRELQQVLFRGVEVLVEENHQK